MASTISTPVTFQRRDESVGESSVVAVVMVEELEEAQRDPRVRSFLDEADSYLVALEQHDRNR
jgi:hypothetical protein